MKDVNILLNQPTAWLKTTQGGNSIVVSSRVRLARNVASMAFPSLIQEEDAVKLWGDIVSILVETADCNKPIVFEMEGLTRVDKDFLVERHLISRDLTRKERGSGLVMKSDETLSIMINEEDHLRMQAMKYGECLQELWKMMDAFDDNVEKKLQYAFSNRYGYLTSCPTNLGTAMRASVMMHLPGLVLLNEITQIIKAVNKIGLVVRGLWGEGTEASGNMFQISNQSSLGETEDDIIVRLKEIVEEIVTHEKNARLRLVEQKSNSLRDHIQRAYGILLNAYMLSSKEALDMLSALWMGLDLNIIKDISDISIKELFLLVQPGHLQKLAGKNISIEKRDIMRARMVRKKLGNPKTFFLDEE
jgi:protein arginine kinase